MAYLGDEEAALEYLGRSIAGGFIICLVCPRPVARLAAPSAEFRKLLSEAESRHRLAAAELHPCRRRSSAGHGEQLVPGPKRRPNRLVFQKSLEVPQRLGGTLLVHFFERTSRGKRATMFSGTS